MISFPYIPNHGICYFRVFPKILRMFGHRQGGSNNIVDIGMRSNSAISDSMASEVSVNMTPTNLTTEPASDREQGTLVETYESEAGMKVREENTDLMNEDNNEQIAGKTEDSGSTQDETADKADASKPQSNQIEKEDPEITNMGGQSDHAQE